MVIAMIIVMSAGILFVAGTLAYFTATNTPSHADFTRLRAQVIENEKTPEGRERNCRFSEFLCINGIG